VRWDASTEPVQRCSCVSLFETMSICSKIRCSMGRPRPRLWISLVGVSSFLLQSMLAFLVMPVVTHAAADQTVVICTLEGSKTVDLDIPSPVHDRSTDYCLALNLLQIANSAANAYSVPTPVRVCKELATLQQRESRRHFRRYSITPYATRAPPVG
jgi:hypothetical protein